MRLGPATQAAFVRGFLRCLITAWRRNDRFSPTALALSQATSAAFAKASCPFLISRSKDLAITNWQDLRWPAVRPAPCSKEHQAGGGGGRNARATSRTCARFWMSASDSPSRIASCRWLCRNHSASSGNFTFRWTHSQPDCCASQHKKVSPLCRTCGRCDFPVEVRGKLRMNFRLPESIRQPFQKVRRREEIT